MLGEMDVSALTGFATDAGVAIGVAGGLFVVALTATQAFPFIGAWIKKVRGAASGR